MRGGSTKRLRLWALAVGLLLTAGLVWVFYPRLKVDFQARHYQRVYQELMLKFPVEHLGKGAEPAFGGETEQPMTYGLVLWSEGLRGRAEEDAQTGARLRQGVNWLVQNADLDGDGKVGWGLPDAWDAFSDGTTNPANQPYTITTAIVLEGLLEALEGENAALWTPEEHERILATVVEASERWCDEVWTEEGEQGFFWYSSSPNDDLFVINPSAMMAGVLQRLVVEQGAALTVEQAALFTRRADAAVRAILSQTFIENDAPFWPYTGLPNRLNHKRPNDLVHHSYILWGLEEYRAFGGAVAIPWTVEDGLASFDSFYRNGKLWDLPSSGKKLFGAARNTPPKLWSAGMYLAVSARFSKPEAAYRTAGEIEQAFGSGPDYTLLSNVGTAEPDTRFYPRYAAHQLFGLANLLFADGER